MAEIALTKGFVAVVDEDDLARVAAKHWCVTTKGYAQHQWSEGGTRHVVTMGRFVLDAPPGLQVDHINGDRLDNRRSNLRLCTREQNARNRAAPSRPGKFSAFKGVYRNARYGKPYLARIKVGPRHHSLGTYDTEHEAASAYDRAALELHGEFARLNFREAA